MPNAEYILTDRITTTWDLTPSSGMSITATITATGGVESLTGEGLVIANPANYSYVTIDGYAKGYSNGVYILAGDITIGTSGVVSGRTGYVCFNNSKMLNNGTITGSEYGLAVGKTFDLSNSGSITGDYKAIQYSALPSFPAYRLWVTNSGTIHGGTWAIHSIGAATHDVVFNTGLIKSDGVTAIDLGGGNDIYDGRGGSVIGIVDLGIGNNTGLGGTGSDSFRVSTGDNFIDGGNGDDTLAFYAATALTVDLNLTEAQNIGIGASTVRGIETLIGGSGNDTFIGDSHANRLVGERGNDTLKGGQGDDTLVGGEGDNIAVFDGPRGNYAITQNANGTVTVNNGSLGQDGVDTLVDIKWAEFGGALHRVKNAEPKNIWLSAREVREDFPVSGTVATITAFDADGDKLTYSIVSDPSNVFRIENDKLILTRALDYETARTHQVIIKAADAYGGETTQNCYVQVANVAEPPPPPPPPPPPKPKPPKPPGPGSDPDLVLWGTPHRDILDSGAGNDLLFGLANKDLMNGRAGNDKLYGGLGNDTMMGGAGLDVFVLDTKIGKTNSKNKKINLDTIPDYVAEHDTIHMKKSIFTKIGKKGVLKKDAFHLGPKAEDAEDRVLYVRKTGALSYDPDGTGEKEPIQIIKLPRHLDLNNTDFFVI